MIHLPVPFINRGWNKKEFLKETQVNLGLRLLENIVYFECFLCIVDQVNTMLGEFIFIEENMYQHLKQESGSLNKVKLKAKII